VGEQQEYYATHGYYLFRGLIPEALIDQVLARYAQDILPSDRPMFRQTSNRWEPHRRTPLGYMEQSLRDIHGYLDFPEFSAVVRQVMAAPEVLQALTQLTGSSEHRVMQTFFFDLNAATPAHQDWYYLDSYPSGHLLAGWFALEDIEEEAGRFYVLPGTHRMDLELNAQEQVMNHNYQKKMMDYVEAQRDKIVAPAMKKGDVLFWNSGTIHGALPTINPRFSRKSMTAHYLPGTYAFGRRYFPGSMPVEYEVHQGVQFRKVSPIHARYTLKAQLITDLWNFFLDRPALSSIVRLVRKQQV